MSASDGGAKLCLTVVYIVCPQMAKVSICCARVLRFGFEGLGVWGCKKIQLRNCCCKSPLHVFLTSRRNVCWCRLSISWSDTVKQSSLHVPSVARGASGIHLHFYSC